MAVNGVYWLNHYSKFTLVEKSSRGPPSINLLFLRFIGVVPFATSLIAENGGALATAIYAGGMVCCGLSLMWIWAYCDARGMIESTLSPGRRRSILLTTLVSSIVFAASIPLAFFSSDLAKWLWVLIIPASLAGRSFAGANYAA